MQRLARVDVGKTFRTASAGLSVNKRLHAPGDLFKVVKIFATNPWIRVCIKSGKGADDQGVFTFMPDTLVLSVRESVPSAMEIYRALNSNRPRPVNSIKLVWDGMSQISRFRRGTLFAYRKLAASGKTDWTVQEIKDYLDPLTPEFRATIGVRGSKLFLPYIHAMHQEGVIIVEYADDCANVVW